MKACTLFVTFNQGDDVRLKKLSFKHPGIKWLA